jgi:hypothetical protein
LLYLLFRAMLFGTTYIINFQQVLKAQDNEPETSPCKHKYEHKETHVIQHPYVLEVQQTQDC